MNNSSAYNNVLLKPSVQTQAQAPVPKRNYQDDQSSASFQQNFKEVHDSVRSQDEKVAKPASKKSAQIDNRKPANDVEKKSPAPAKKVEESRSRDQVADNEKTTDSNESPANQNAENKSAENQNPANQDSSAKETESKSAAKKVCVDEDTSLDTLMADVLLTNTNIPASLSVATPVDEVLATTPVVSDVQANTSKLPTDEVLSGALTTDINATTDLVMGGVSKTVSDSPAKGDQPIITDGEAASSDADTSLAIAQQPVLDNILGQAPVTTTPEAALTQDPAVLAAASSAVLPKPVLAQATQTTVASDTSDADSLSALINPAASEKTSSKVATASDLGVTSTPDVTTAQSQAVDVKSTFEKTLQNMIVPTSAKQEDSTALPATSQTASAPSGATNSLDSMLRFSEAQTPATRSFVVQTAVPVPVGQPQWSQAVGEKVLWLAAQNVSSAEIHLNPENLGPMQVKVSVNQEQTTINFTSHHAVVREVLDQNLGRLRDMFSEQGLNLVNVDVSDKSFSRQQGDAKDQKGQANTNDTQVEDEAPVAMSLIKQQRLVDHYA